MTKHDEFYDDEERRERRVIPRNLFPVQLMNGTHVTLNRQEWRFLQGYLRRFDAGESVPDFEIYPKNVRRVIRDWIIYKDKRKP